MPPPRDIFNRASGVKRLLKTVKEPSFDFEKNAEGAAEGDVEPADDIAEDPIALKKFFETVKIRRSRAARNVLVDAAEGATETTPEATLVRRTFSKTSSANEAAEDRIALKKFFESVTFEPGEKVDYTAALEKATKSINERAQDIAGRPDRAHELASLRRHAHQLKAWPKYFANVTPEPQSQTEPANDYVAWKRRMAASRRENLRTGLVKLSYRKAAREIGVAHGSRERIREREKALYAPQREDDRLTATTVISAVSALQTGASIPDPNREARVEASKLRVQGNIAAREQLRRDALHTLYMNARDFIVTEEQLDAKVEEIFTDTPHAANDHRSNIWDVLGAPITVQAMLGVVNNTQKGAMDFHKGGGARTADRMKKISEELTGGKMD